MKFLRRDNLAPFSIWGEGHEETAVLQLMEACELPVTVGAAGMPDLHQGYGLPIGGVLATRGAVVPYAVGMDIACRMRLTVYNIGTELLESHVDALSRVINTNTRFGLGASWSTPKDHEVMHDPLWTENVFLRGWKNLAWEQLGTSGSGNHFVEFGVFTSLATVMNGAQCMKPGTYLALLSHSGSRGIGGKVCQFYSQVAQDQFDDLPDHLKRLAWLDIKGDWGREYMAVMTLLGRYAAANHEIIHRLITKSLGFLCDVEPLFEVENHHNFAWLEEYNGETLVIHRKGATPAAAGVLGVIPGTMATRGYLVRGRGNEQAYNSASHGAGRAMSRTATKKKYTWAEAEEFLKLMGVTLISGGLDEIPMGYKDIEKVMLAQTQLVDALGTFDPKIVKMAPGTEKAED